MVSEPDAHERLLQQRRDCEPHRGMFLNSLVTISLFFLALSLCAGIGGVLSLILGIVVWKMASHDLAQMDQGMMDMRGEDATKIARDCAKWTVILSILLTVFWGMFWIIGTWLLEIRFW
jgi:hypothetical protein